MKLEINPWKILVYLVWICGVGFFMIPTEEAIETFIFNRWGVRPSWMWLPLYIILWQLWRGVKWLYETEQSMTHKES